MRLIVDTNQADPIRFTRKQLDRKSYPTLVIPYLVWTELLEGPESEKRRRALQKFPLLFGMEMVTVFDELARRSEAQIRTFVPIYSNHSRIHKRIEGTFVHPTPNQVRIAKEVRENGRKNRATMLNNLPSLHQKHRRQDMAANSRGEISEQTDWHTIHDGEHHLFLKDDAPYRKWLIEEVSTDGDGTHRSIVAASGHSMFDAAWDNPMLRRFLKLLALVRLGYAQRVWEDPKLNRLPSMKHDDMPDISLVLYAREGDTILTSDNIKERIRQVDAENRISISTWRDWLAVQATSAR